MSKKIIAPIILFLGIIIAILGTSGSFSSEGLTNGATTIFIAYPLILIGFIWLLINLFKK